MNGMSACFGLLQFTLGLFCLAASIIMEQNGVHAVYTPVLGAMQVTYGLFRIVAPTPPDIH